jgi:hypothetical protein
MRSLLSFLVPIALFVQSSTALAAADPMRAAVSFLQKLRNAQYASASQQFQLPPDYSAAEAKREQDDGAPAA